ncbi:MAG: hypothetical protein U0V64_14730 [Cyclobacteriaceae bacterium]
MLRNNRLAAENLSKSSSAYETPNNLFQYTFEKLDVEETQSPAEIEQNIFLAYLAVNQSRLLQQGLAMSTTDKVPAHLRLAAMFLSQSYPYSDIVNYNEVELFSCQLIKSLFLFELLEANTKTTPLLQAFLEYYHCTSWACTLHKLLPIVIVAINKQNEGHIDIEIRKDSDFEQNCLFIDKLAIDQSKELTDYDFKKFTSNTVVQSRTRSLSNCV